MSNYELQPNYETPRSYKTLVVFGATPVSNYPGEEEARAWEVANTLRRGQYNLVVYVGGDRWVDPKTGQEWTEASYLRSLVDENLVDEPNVLSVSVLELDHGNETYSQTRDIAEFLFAYGDQLSDIDLITSWHQLSRVRVLLNSFGHTKLNYYRFAYEQSIKEELESSFNFMLGYFYTLMLIMMQSMGQWEDGGPLIENISNDRLENGENGKGLFSNFGIVNGQFLKRILQLFKTVSK